MENKNTLITIVAVIVVLVMIYWFLKSTGAINKEISTNTNTDTGTSASSTPTSTGIGTGTPPPNPNQITVTKTVPKYYRTGTLDTQTNKYGYPFHYSGPVAGKTYSSGDTFTFVGQPLNSFSGLGLMYETTERVSVNLPPEYSNVYFVRQTDL